MTVKEQKDIRRDIILRVFLVFFLAAIFGVLILGKVFKIQSDGRKAEKAGDIDSLITRYDTVQPVRGNIYSLDGKLIATTPPLFNIRMDLSPEYIREEDFQDNVDSIAWHLSQIFPDISQLDFARKLNNGRQRGSRSCLLKRKVTFPQLQQVRRIPFYSTGRYSAFNGGLIVEEYTQPHREYPYGILAKRTIGYKRDTIYVGLEGAYQEYLYGIEGAKLMKQDSSGYWVPAKLGNELDPVPGSDLVTTIDIDIQDVAENALYKHLSIHEASEGCAVLMEVSTGEIRAIANLQRDTASGEYYETYNMAVGRKADPGSTFKLMSLVAGMEDGKFDLNDTVYVGPGWWTVYGRTIRDDHAPHHPVLTMKEVFEASSNVGVAKKIYSCYARTPREYTNRLLEMGLGDPSGVEISGEPDPVLKTPDMRNTPGAKIAWYGTTLPYMSHGYEVELTPLQILTFYNAIANNGKKMKPQFVREIRTKGKVIKTIEPTVLKERIASEKTIVMAREMLEGVVQNGTAQRLKSSPYKVAGKTGTAQIYNPRTNNYSFPEGRRYRVSFVGYFPADNPRYSCIVVVSWPKKGQKYASQVAVPVFKEIADKVYSTTLDIHHKETEIQFNPGVPYVKAAMHNDIRTVWNFLGYQPVLPDSGLWVGNSMADPARFVPVDQHSNNRIPDVRGFGPREAAVYLEKMGLKVKLQGKGKVKKTVPSIGEEFNYGDEVILILSI